jgi:hypothetical protein
MDKVKKVLSSINKIAKEDKTLSRLLPKLDVPLANVAGSVAGALGYGTKKRAPRKTGGAKKTTAKKTGGAKKRAPRKRGMGAPVSDMARFYSAVGEAQNFPRVAAAARAGEDASRLYRSAFLPSTLSRHSSARPSTLDDNYGMGKKGKGFGGFLQKLIQAPLAGLAATSGGLHGALGSFGKKKRGGRKMLGVMPLANLM